jgi:hypothetical protein
VNVAGARLGGLVINGGLSGEMVALGNVFGDLTLNGGLKSGRLAFEGNDTGNLTINGGVDASSAIVVSGNIGDAITGTNLNIDNLKGILAVEGTVNFNKSFNSKGALFFQTNLGSGNANSNALNAIFTNNGQKLLFDLASPMDLKGLVLILADLSTLKVNSSGNLTGTIP